MGHKVKLIFRSNWSIDVWPKTLGKWRLPASQSRMYFIM